MEVLLLSQFYPPIIGGEENHVRNLAAALVRRGHGVSIATLWYPGAKERESSDGIDIHRIKGSLQRVPMLYAEAQRRHVPPFPDPELTLRLKQIMDAKKPDVVHAHNWLLYSYLPLKRSYDANLVVTLHDLSLICPKKTLMHREGPCSGPALRKCLSCAGAHYGVLKGSITTVASMGMAPLVRSSVDKFIAVSHAVATLNRLDRSDVPFEVIPNFVSDDVANVSEIIDPRIADLPEEGYILFVGDLRLFKGIDVLLKAYEALGSDVPLVLIGRDLPETPKNIPANVRILNSLPHAAVMQAWRRCLFGVAPSIGPEACATVVIEAMSMGRPMIATDIGGMPDLVDHGNTGLLISPGSVEELTQAMDTLLGDRKMRQAMGSAGILRAKRFSISSIVPRIEAVYDGLRTKATSPIETSTVYTLPFMNGGVSRNSTLDDL